MSEYYWTPKRIKELKARGYKLHSSQESLIKKGNRLTNKENYEKEIEKNKGASTIFTCHKGEAPDIT